MSYSADGAANGAGDPRCRGFKKCVVHAPQACADYSSEAACERVI